MFVRLTARLEARHPEVAKTFIWPSLGERGSDYSHYCNHRLEVIIGDIRRSIAVSRYFRAQGLPCVTENDEISEAQKGELNRMDPVQGM